MPLKPYYPYVATAYAWARSADQILDYEEGRTVLGAFGPIRKESAR